MTKLRPELLRQLIKLVIIICLATIFIIIVRTVTIKPYLVASLMWVKGCGIYGPLAFILIYNLATLLLIPGGLLTIGGGVLFGLFWGTIYVFIAAILGATCAFLIGRYFSRNWVIKQMEKYPVFQEIETAIMREGWRIVLLARLSPILPFNLLNYALGIMQISLRDYILGSLGIIPGVIMYVYFGSLIGDMANLGNEAQNLTLEMTIYQWIIRLIGLVSTVGITIYLTKVAKKAILG